jgi:hypothetical protein
VPQSSLKPWVFVHISKVSSEPPSFYVMTQSRLHDILAPGDKAYRERYLVKHGQEYGDRAGVYKLSLTQAAPHENAWSVVLQLLGIVGPS